MRLAEYSGRKFALGGDITLSFVGNFSTTSAATLFRELWQQVGRFEKRFSRFIASSELSLLNSRAGTTFAVSPAMAQLLRAALQQAERTNGLYNPFILPALQREGYVGSAHADSPNLPELNYSRRVIGSPADLKIKGDEVRMPFMTALDLGGCGKGYLADQLGEFLRQKGAVGYWLEFSGDIATFGYDANGESIYVGVQDALINDRSRTDLLVQCPVAPAGVATSGTFRRPAHDGTLKSHHIIDPRTNQPANTDMLLATVCAPSAIDADVLASCVVIIGSKNAASFLKTSTATSWIIQY